MQALGLELPAEAEHFSPEDFEMLREQILQLVLHDDDGAEEDDQFLDDEDELEPYGRESHVAEADRRSILEGDQQVQAPDVAAGDGPGKQGKHGEGQLLS